MALLFCVFTADAQTKNSTDKDGTLVGSIIGSDEYLDIPHTYKPSFEAKLTGGVSFVDANEAVQILKDHLATNFSAGDEDNPAVALRMQYIQELSNSLETGKTVSEGLIQNFYSVQSWNEAQAANDRLSAVVITDFAIDLLKR